MAHNPKQLNNKRDIVELEKRLEKIRKDNSLKDSTSAEQPLHRKTFFCVKFLYKVGLDDDGGKMPKEWLFHQILNCTSFVKNP